MAGALLALGTSPLWWRLATTPGTAMPHALLIAAALALLIRWHHTDRHAHFSAALLAYALSFGLGQPSLTFLPALVYLVMKTGWKRLLTPARAGWVLFCVALAAGLAVHSATALGLARRTASRATSGTRWARLRVLLQAGGPSCTLVLLGAVYLPDLDAVAGGPSACWRPPICWCCASRGCPGGWTSCCRSWRRERVQLRRPATRCSTGRRGGTPCRGRSGWPRRWSCCWRPRPLPATIRTVGERPGGNAPRSRRSRP
ncbi:MAG: hypothetical protein U1F77_02915 [Kiritimatiellia bacterium]